MRILTTILVVLLGLVGLAAAFLYKGDLPAAFVDQKYSSENSRFLETDYGARIHYRDEGTGEPVVLIHGSNASLHTWEPWVAELGSSYRVITLDLPGHGLTGKVPDNDYSSEAQIRTVNAVVDHLGIESFVLGGNSMGGGVTWRYALRHPERVDAMLLVNSSRPWSWSQTQQTAEPPGEAPIAFQLLQQQWFRAIARYLDPRMLIEQGVPAAYNNSPVVTPQLIDRYYELSLREGTREATLSGFRGERPRGPGPDLSVLDQPTLVMWGAQDSLISVDVAGQFAEVLPDTSVVIYEDLGHVPMEEAPSRTARDILAFLDDLSPTTLQLPVGE